MGISWHLLVKHNVLSNILTCASDSIQKICATNFLHPDDLKKKAPAKGKKGGKHKMKDKPVELLDDGYFGKGIYFTVFSDYA